jgi:hypothetical protein
MIKFLFMGRGRYRTDKVPKTKDPWYENPRLLAVHQAWRKMRKQLTRAALKYSRARG